MDKTKRVFVSIPMSQDNAKDKLIDKYIMLENHGLETIDSWLEGAHYRRDYMKMAGIRKEPAYFIAESLRLMSMCDVVYFCEGWENAVGCKVEHSVAKQYGFEIMYEVEHV